VLRQLLVRPEIAALRKRAPHRLGIVRRLVRSGSIPEHAVVEAPGHRMWLFDDIAQVLRLFATACPLLIVLEDLQAASEDSLLLLRFLARHLEEARIMVLGTFRRMDLSDDHPLTATLGELRRVPSFKEITIGGLSKDDTSELVGRHVSKQLVRELHRRTGGHPLFLKEILRDAAGRLEPHTLAREHACALLQREGAPAAVRDLVAQRVRGLTRDTRALFDAAAVLGEEFEPADAARLVGRRPDAIGDDLEALRKQGFFQAARPPATTTEFTHPIVREAVLDLLTPRRARELHGKAAGCLERAGADEHTRRLPQLAYHAFAALPFGSIGRAVRYGRAAAAQAASGFAYEDAARLYRQTLAAAALRQRPVSRERAELLVALAEVASRTADQGTARASALEAFHLARRLRRSDLGTGAACALGPSLLCLQTGAVDEERVDLLEEALRLIPRGEKAQRIRVCSHLAVALYWSPDSRRCMAVADTAVELARKLREPAPLAYALYARCVARWRPGAGRPDGGSVREAIRVADRAGEWDLALASAVRLGHLLTETGEFDSLDRLIIDLDRRAEALGYPQARLWPLMFQAARLARQRKLDVAAAAIDRVRAAAREAWEPGGEAYYALLLGLLRLEQGTFQGLPDVFDRLVIDTPDLPVEAPLPLILAAVGDFERARRVYDRLIALRPWETSNHMGTIASLALLAECASRFDDRETAGRIYPILATHADEYAVIAGVAGLLQPVTYALGQLCGTLGRYDEAIAHFERCLDQCRRAKLLSDTARTHLAWARVLARRDARGDRGRARALGRQAQRRAEKLDIPALAADVMTFAAGLTERTG
jgi:tetratricopeptide (TPR) repeat protein